MISRKELYAALKELGVHMKTLKSWIAIKAVDRNHNKSSMEVLRGHCMYGSCMLFCFSLVFLLCCEVVCDCVYRLVSIISKFDAWRRFKTSRA